MRGPLSCTYLCNSLRDAWGEGSALCCSKSVQCLRASPAIEAGCLFLPTRMLQENRKSGSQRQAFLQVNCFPTYPSLSSMRK